MNQNLILSIYPSQIEHLRLKIEVAQLEIEALKTENKDNSFLVNLKKQQIEDDQAAKKKLSDDYDDAHNKMLRRACYVESQNKSFDKKP